LFLQIIFNISSLSLLAPSSEGASDVAEEHCIPERDPSSSSSAEVLPGNQARLNILNNSYVCGEKRLGDCLAKLQALDSVSAQDKATTLKFHELPERLSRGHKFDQNKTCHCRNKSQVLFSTVETFLGLHYEFRYKIIEKEIREEIIVRVKHLNLNVWEIRAFRKVGTDESVILTDDFLNDHWNSVNFLIMSTIDILEMTCFYASLHKTYTDMTIDLKRYIVFQYDNKESNNVTLTGKGQK
jgi:hypothetical protein